MFKSHLEDLIKNDEGGLFESIFGADDYKVRVGDNNLNTCLVFDIFERRLGSFAWGKILTVKVYTKHFQIATFKCQYAPVGTNVLRVLLADPG